MSATYLYFIQRGFGSIKIGVSDDPDARCADLQTGNSQRLRVIAKFPMGSRTAAFALEKELHERFAHLCLSGEWFRHRVLREMKVKGKRVIGGTPRNPMVRTPTGWAMVDAPREVQRNFSLRDLAIFRE